MGINNKQIAEDFTPDPISLLESNRNLGYSIEEAVSDLIDNSISALATEIQYEIKWNDGDPYFILRDDGKGMSNKNNELINSFRLGSTNPLEDRDPKDLGRFGFGMKTASLSQARILNVISKKNSTVYARSLDLDFINKIGKWNLRFCDENSIKDELSYLDGKKSGTIIKWEKWDRAPKTKEDFESLISTINNYLSVCFHRFIEKGIKIFCHETELKACDPIPKGEGAHKFSEIRLSKDNSAKQTAYILQHPLHWDDNYEDITRFNSFKLFDGFERQQGIYIYRCDRLLTPKAGWLGLLRKGNSAKLARVIIDYPNSADHLWSLDITKTNATIPFEFKRAIQKLITAAKHASTTKINRGARVISENITIGNNSHIWASEINTYHNSYKYHVDIKHPIFQNYLDEKKVDRKDLSHILELISDNLPISKIIENNDIDPSKHDRIIKKDKLSNFELFHAKSLFDLKLQTLSKAKSLDWIMNHEPFCYYEDQLKKYLNG